MASEKLLKAALVKQARGLMPSAVIIRHEDLFTAGIPDMSSTYRGSTIWWEVKYAKPSIRDRGIQHLTCCNLAIHGKCFYIVYHETKKQKQTIIVAPQFLHKFKECTTKVDGFDHKWIARFIKDAHDNYR